MSSSRQAQTIAPRPPSATDAGPSSPTPDSKALNPRILRKREADRKCQRLIRERTKSRIADLEATVKEYERKDASGLSNLIKQLADARQERDALLKKVQNIEHILSDGRMALLDKETSKDGSPDINTSRGLDQSPPNSFDADGPDSRHNSFDDGVPLDIPPYERERETTRHIREPVHLTATPRFEISRVPGSLKSNIQDSSLVNVHTAADSNINPNPARSEHVCDCLEALQVRNQKTPFNIWRYANDVLSSRFQWPTDYNRTIPDDFIHDIPVRVVLEGWDAVERRGPVHPSWQILKYIDQAIFWRCEPRERLAVLYTMHALFQSHSDPATSNVPSFFQKSPSESHPDSYAINYFTWPGVRKKFFEGQHRYCTNDFWTYFTRNLRVLWQYEFRDCYTRNTETQLYTISPLFRERIGNISAWAMGPEMLQRWPDFRSDIPSFESIPGSISDKIVLRNHRISNSQAPFRGSIHSPTQGPGISRGSNQNSLKTQQDRSESEAQQGVPVLYDQMMWSQLVPSQYSHFEYPPMVSSSTENYTHSYM